MARRPRADARERVADPPKAPPADYRRVAGPVTALAPAGSPSGDDVGSSTALCPYRMQAVSGGFRTITGGGETFYSDALTKSRVGWTVAAVNDVATSGTVQAFAYCVRSDTPGGPGTRRASRQAARRGEAGGGGCDRQVQDSPRRAALTAAGRRTKLGPDSLRSGLTVGRRVLVPEVEVRSLAPQPRPRAVLIRPRRAPKRASVKAPAAVIF